jgi:hypothetical protein
MEANSPNQLSQDQTALLLEEIKTNNRLLRDVLQRIERIERYIGQQVSSEETGSQRSNNLNTSGASEGVVDLTDDTDDTDELRPSKRQKQENGDSSTRKISKNRGDLIEIEILVEIRPEESSSKEEINSDAPKSKNIKLSIDRRFPADLTRITSTLQTETGVPEVSQRLYVLEPNGMGRMLESTDQLYSGCHLLLVERNRQADMQIYVKFPEGKTVSLNVDPKDRIKELKQMIRELEGTPEKLQRIFFGGKMLDDDDVIQNCRVSSGVTLLIHPKLTTIA